MANYEGYFRGSFENNFLYRVRFITDSAATSYTEIKLAGDSPFVLTLNTNQTAFEPLCTSTATIRVVHDTYLEEILPTHIHDTAVKMDKYNELTQAWDGVYSGYLTPKIYSQPWDNCFETFALEATGKILALQYFDYETVSAGTKQIITLKQCLQQVCEKGDFAGFVWINAYLAEDGGTVTPERLKISERNFFTNDTFVYARAQVRTFTFKDKKTGADRTVTRMRILSMMLLSKVMDKYTSKLSFLVPLECVDEDFCKSLKKLAHEYKGEVPLQAQVIDVRQGLTLTLNPPDLRVSAHDIIPELEALKGISQVQPILKS